MNHDHVAIRDDYVARKLLRHQDLDDLRIYNYLDTCKLWDNITLNTRGIILNRKTGEIVAQPFPKFFNVNQRNDTMDRNLPWKDGFRIYEKVDGWLGILYRYNGKFCIATRGSFDNYVAKWATDFLERYNLEGLPENLTLLFEIVCPATKIVVDYAGCTDLVLLAAYDRFTGEECSWEHLSELASRYRFSLVKTYDKTWLGYIKGNIKTGRGTTEEGYVIRFDNGLRVKFKLEDYMRRHRLLNGLTPLTIWNNMKDGKVLSDVASQIDPEYQELFSAISSSLETAYTSVMKQALADYGRLVTMNLGCRADFARLASKTKHPAILFLLFDNAADRLDDLIMKIIRPDNNVCV